MAAIDGPRVQARSGKPKQLVVFLHGYGADGADLIEIGRQWRAFLPDADFVAPHAPDRCAASPTGRQWFPLTMRDPEERWRGCVAARPMLDAFLDDELARRGFDDRALALVGFSQGTMMALHTGLRRKRAPRAILGYSGVYVLGPAADEVQLVYEKLAGRPSGARRRRRNDPRGGAAYVRQCSGGLLACRRNGISRRGSAMASTKPG